MLRLMNATLAHISPEFERWASVAGEANKCHTIANGFRHAQIRVRASERHGKTRRKLLDPIDEARYSVQDQQVNK